MSADAAALTLDQLVVGHDGRALTLPLDLALQPGEVVALTGPSGIGKTTVLRTIVRLCDPVAGRVFIGGVSHDELPPTDLRRRAALVAQHATLLGPTVSDDLAAAAAPTTVAPGARALLTALGLPAAVHNQPSAGLSGGERARVAVVRALLAAPAVLLLDEPSAALDDGATAQLAAVIRAAGERGIAALVVTHDQRLLDETRARTLILRPAATT